VSENISRLLGYTSEEARVPGWWLANLHAEDRDRVIGIIPRLSKGEKASREYRFARKDRSFVWLHEEMCLQPGGGGESEIVGTLTDISERKMAEEEIHLKSAALEAAANAVVITDRDGSIRWANPAFGALTGYSIAESIGKRPRDLLGSGRQDSTFYGHLWATILSGKVWSGALVNRKKSGEQYSEEMTITPVLDRAGRVANFVAIKNDITERVIAEARLELALRQKVELLREIHHRVYNNMQVIISLLSISSQDILEPELRQKIEDITRRMHAMAIIHQQFHDTEDMSRIDFAEYMEQLLESLRAEFPASAINASVAGKKKQVLLNLDQAIPAALIVEELLTNSLKFAFSDGREPGTILLTQRLGENDRLEIELRDDGVGLPPDLDPRRAQTIGMTLIHILSDQLGGIVEFRNGENRGTVATLVFTMARGGSRPS
jgi:PAS domain S-box-containing protein